MEYKKWLPNAYFQYNTARLNTQVWIWEDIGLTSTGYVRWSSSLKLTMDPDNTSGYVGKPGMYDPNFYGGSWADCCNRYSDFTYERSGVNQIGMSNDRDSVIIPGYGMAYYRKLGRTPWIGWFMNIGAPPAGVAYSSGRMEGSVHAEYYITNQMCPVADFDWPGELCCSNLDENPLNSYSFDPDNGTTPGDGISNYRWEILGDGWGGPIVYEDPSFESIALDPASFGAGNYIVRLKVTDDDGYFAEKERSISIMSPVALIVSPVSGVGQNETLQLSVANIVSDAVSLLSERGWRTEILLGEQATLTNVCQRLGDRCVAGMVIVSHGGTCKTFADRGSTLQFASAGPGTNECRPGIQCVGSGDFGNCLPNGKELKFLKIIACNARAADFSEDFTVADGNLTDGCSPRLKIPETKLDILDDRDDCFRLNAPGYVILLAEELCSGYYQFPDACAVAANLQPPDQHAPFSLPENEIQTQEGSGCYSFPVCDSSGQCGEDLFPTKDCAFAPVVCSSGIAVLTTGQALLEVRSYASESQDDTVLMGIAAFGNVPIDLQIPAMNQTECWIAVTSSRRSGETEDSMIILLSSQLLNVPSTVESLDELGVYWIDSDSYGNEARVELLPKRINVSEGTISFKTLRSSGIAGVYQLEVSCGDADGTGSIDIFDVVQMVDLVFRNGHNIPNPRGLDVNCDGAHDVFDVILLINHAFRNEIAPSCPSCE